MLDFLSKVTLDETVEVKERKAPAKKERNPKEGLVIRLFKDGSVYPSQELVDKFALEYAGKDVESGYGFDFIDSRHFPTFKTPQALCLISPVKKTEGKVDLFATTAYNEDGSPKQSVMDQGAKTFGKDDMIPTLEEVYGIKFNRAAVTEKLADGAPEGTEPKILVPAITDGVDFVDLMLVANPNTGEPWTLTKAIAFIPKKVSRGEAKGSITTMRRENPKLYALVPMSSIATQEEPAEETGTQTVDTEDTTIPTPTHENELVAAGDDDLPFKA